MASAAAGVVAAAAPPPCVYEVKVLHSCMSSFNSLFFSFVVWIGWTLTFNESTVDLSSCARCGFPMFFEAPLNGISGESPEPNECGPGLHMTYNSSKTNEGQLLEIREQNQRQRDECLSQTSSKPVGVVGVAGEPIYGIYGVEQCDPMGCSCARA